MYGQTSRQFILCSTNSILYLADIVFASPYTPKVDLGTNSTPPYELAGLNSEDRFLLQFLADQNYFGSINNGFREQLYYLTTRLHSGSFTEI